MKRSAFFVVLAAGLASASAQASVITALDFSQGWGNSDTRTGGTMGIVTDQPRNGNGSLRLTTDDSIAGASQAKASVVGGTGGSMGTLGALAAAGGVLTMDFFRDASSTVPSFGSVNVKLYVVNSSGQSANLNWEAVYNGLNVVTPNAWYDDHNIGAGNFWIRSGGHNFDTNTNFQSLSSWSGGYTAIDGADTSVTLDAGTSITGIELGFGSGVTGYFKGYADDLNVSFVGGASYSYNFEVPAPGAVGLFATSALLAGLRRRR